MDDIKPSGKPQVEPELTPEQPIIEQPTVEELMSEQPVLGQVSQEVPTAMPVEESKPAFESGWAPASGPDTASPTEPVYIPGAATALPKPKRKVNIVILALGILGIVLLGLLSAALYMKWTEVDDTKADLTEAKSQLSQAKSALTTVQGELDKKDVAAETVAKQPTDEEQISAAAKAYDLSRAGAVARQGFEWKIVDHDGDFAQVSGISGVAVVKKSPTGTWVVVHYGQALPDAVQAKAFGLPVGYYAD